MSPKLGDGLGNVLGTKVPLDSSPLDNEKYPPLKSPNYDKSVAFWSASRIKKKEKKNDYDLRKIRQQCGWPLFILLD